jgi:acylphosphatase
MLGLKGWVRNTENGQVEAVFEGEEAKVNKMVEWCNKGPALAKVSNVDIKKQNLTDEYEDFSIRY